MKILLTLCQNWVELFVHNDSQQQFLLYFAIRWGGVFSCSFDSSFFPMHVVYHVFLPCSLIDGPMLSSYCVLSTPLFLPTTDSLTIRKVTILGKKKVTRVKSNWYIREQACCTVCQCRPFPMHLHQKANTPIQLNHRNF